MFEIFIHILGCRCIETRTRTITETTRIQIQSNQHSTDTGKYKIVFPWFYNYY